MSKEPWEIAEDDFDKHWKKLGKKAHLFEFKDARYLRGMNKRPTAVGNQPSDRLVTYEGVTFFAEVKYTDDPKRFHFNRIKPSQIAFATQCCAAGGDYRIYIKSGFHNQWYCVPFPVIQGTDGASLTWDELADHATEINPYV